METSLKDSARKFKVNERVEISDFGKIKLDHNEMVSFVTESGKEYDFTAKNWGFYASPSINERLVKEGFKTALVKNTMGKYYIMVVENDKLKEFNEYLKIEENFLVEWLDEK
jgi:hypothetical protein